MTFTHFSFRSLFFFFSYRFLRFKRGLKSRVQSMRMNFMTEIYSRVFILKDLQAHLQFLIEPFNPSIHPSESLSLMDLQHPRFQVWIGFSCEVWNGDPVVQYFTFKSPSSRPSSSGLYKFKLKAILSLMYPDSQRLKIKRKSTN